MERAPTLFERVLRGQLAVGPGLVGAGILFLVAGLGVLYFGFDMRAIGMPTWTGEGAIGLGAVLFVLGWMLAFAGR